MTFEKKRILIIDDEEDLVDIMKSVLLDDGYEVFTAADGEEGLQQTEKTSPHLIILDMNMPRMGGIAFYHAIYNKAIEQPKHPVLVVTARANLSELFKELNVDGFMTKPFKLDDLRKEIAVILAKRYGGAVASSSPKAVGAQKRVLIVESDVSDLGKAVGAFLTAGFLVDPANTAVKAIEFAMVDQTDLILINISLPDLPGDLLARKLKQLPKTMDIPVMLYAKAKEQSHLAIAKEICKDVDIKAFVETSDPAILLKEAQRFLKH